MKTSPKSRINSFRHAFSGILKHLIREPNFLIQLSIGILVVAAGFVFGITPVEWVLVLILIALVLVAEGFNTALEKLADEIHPEKSPGIKALKDISAGAVLIAAMVSAVAGVIIFWKYIFSTFAA